VVFKFYLLEMCATVFRQINIWLLEHRQTINSQFHEYILQTLYIMCIYGIDCGSKYVLPENKIGKIQT